MEKSFNYVRTYRQRYGLSVHELAHLINRSPGYVPQMEYGDSVPSLEVALALQVLFRQHPRRLFAGLYDAVEDGVMRQAAELLASLEDRDDRRSAAKREFLEKLATPDNDEGV